MATGALAAACSHGARDRQSGPVPATEARHADAAVAAPTPTAPRPPATRPQLDGHAFPDGVLALTWDDGPDADTLRLAHFLAREKVSATFFVIHEWIKGVSSDPGEGRGVFRTGFRYLPVLAELVRLGHRVGNHTLNHVLLADASPAQARAQLTDNQRAIDPYVTDERPLFRAPGGQWGSGPSAVVDGDPYLRHLVGPIKWDVDRKDWDSSLSCVSDTPARDCEPAGPGGRSRVKVSVTIARYLATIGEQRHGIVLMHDRVGFVGSHYALQIAEAVVPALEKRGFVFAAPVLAFSPLRARSAPAVGPAGAFALGDLDGDGKADLCAGGASITCALARLTGGGASDTDPRPHAAFGDARAVPGAAGGGAFQLADVDGDGRADLCTAGPAEIDCALSKRGGAFAPVRRWTVAGGAWAGARLADVSGDGRADACARTATGVTCARGAPGGFEAARVWSSAADAATWLQNTPIVPGDIDGDGRADACGWSAAGVACALSTGGAFRPPQTWSAARGGADRWIGLGDLNRDGRADLCFQSPAGVSCAFSNGHAFTTPTEWTKTPAGAASFALGDVNGDGRTDLCLVAGGRVLCGVAP